MLFSKKARKATDQERQLHYGDGPLEGKSNEVGLEVAAYARAARYFEKSIAADYRKKARSWRWVAIVSLAMAFMAILAVLNLTPLKTVEPYVLSVDRNNGSVALLKPGTKSSDTPEVIEDKGFIYTYVMARESYNWANQRASYAQVKLMSYEDVFNEYKNFQLSTKGYVTTLGQSQQIRVQIDSILPLTTSDEPKLEGKKGVKTYQVRFSQTLLNADGKPVVSKTNLDAAGNPKPNTIYFVALISFDYDNPPVSEGEQWMNPKGFGVQAYSKTQEMREGS